MNLSRRSFMKGVAATMALAAVPITAVKVAAKAVAAPVIRTFTITGLMKGDTVRMFSYDREGHMKEFPVTEISPGEETFEIDPGAPDKEFLARIRRLQKSLPQPIKPFPVLKVPWNPDA